VPGKCVRFASQGSDITTSAPATVPATFTVSGAVIEHLWGRNPHRPPGVSIRVGTDRSGSFSARSDANGRYTVSGVPADTIWVEATADSGYRSPCPFGGTLGADAVVDVHIIDANVLSADGPPPTWPGSNLPFTGKVFEMAGGSRHALPGASVSIGGQIGTLTNSRGEFITCIAPQNRSGTWAPFQLNFSKDGFAPVSRSFSIEYDTIDMQLTRR
jgi:hypothetical protein